MSYWKYRNDAERILSRVAEDPGGCWHWTGALTSEGYGRLSAHGRQHKAHRLSYQTFVGPVADDLDLDHLCRVRRCVNPAHLEPVTHHENMLRGSRATATHCPANHPYDEVNTYIAPNGGRICRTCRNTGIRRYYEQRGGVVAVRKARAAAKAAAA